MIVFTSWLSEISLHSNATSPSAPLPPNPAACATAFRSFESTDPPARPLPPSAPSDVRVPIDDDLGSGRSDRQRCLCGALAFGATHEDQVGAAVATRAQVLRAMRLAFAQLPMLHVPAQQRCGLSVGA